MLLLASPRVESAPSWLVSNGETTVGPVQTELLVRGVEHGRIHDDCWVRDLRSETWRRIDEVREVRALRGRQGGPSAQRSFSRAGKSLDLASDLGEAYLFLLHGAAIATHSDVGALHRVREPVDLPVTSCVFGLPDGQLGEIVAGGDPLLAIAKRGELVVGKPEDGLTERRIAHRLDADGRFAGVAMVPVLYGTELTAMLELGRYDHPFRQSDRDALARLAALTANRVEELSW